jgi:hypothetical protein
VLVLVNYPESEDPGTHLENYEALTTWIRENPHPDITFHAMIKSLPRKHAGVGLARKILMDEAVRHAPKIISCLDADSCVQKNYLEAIWDFFQSDLAGCAIHFEHPLDGPNTEAITAYELHLRYYVEAQRWIGVPYAYHTVGSSMAVQTTDYCKTGGMNVRKAGEDFYFLQKIIPRGFGTITTTTVIPSDRISNRVPFGTGKAVSDFMESRQQLTYNPDALEVVKNWLSACMTNWDQDDVSGFLPGFINRDSFINEWQRMARMSTSHDTWKRHFFAWFDGFNLMKMLHHLRDHVYPNIPVEEAAAWLLSELDITPANDSDGLLVQYRALEKKL